MGRFTINFITIHSFMFLHFLIQSKDTGYEVSLKSSPNCSSYPLIPPRKDPGSSSSRGGAEPKSGVPSAFQVTFVAMVYLSPSQLPVSMLVA